MLTKCSNPSCSAPFRHLHDGQLFRLEGDPAIRSTRFDRPEYFWLCAGCSSTMTLRLHESEGVIAVTLPPPLRIIPDGVTVAIRDRKGGLLLRNIDVRLPKSGRDRSEGRPSNNAA